MAAGWQALIASALAGSVGLTELVTRYRSDPRRAVVSLAAVLYVALNAGAGAAALYLVRAFGWTFGHASNVTLWRILIAGFGALALFRSSLFVAKIGGASVGVGPSALLEGLLGMLDRDVDRKCAKDISKQISEADLAELNPETVVSTLPVLCLALMQNFPAGDQALLGAEMSKIGNEEDLTDQAKMRAVLIQLAKYLGADLVGRVLHDVRSLLVLPPPEAARAVLKEAKKAPEPEAQVRGAGKAKSRWTLPWGTG
jgi:hypothetical protein